MEDMNLKCQLVSKVSSKGNPYTVLTVYLTDTCKKDIFLTDAELELLKLKNNNVPDFLR